MILQRETEHRRKVDAKNQKQVVDMALNSSLEKVARRGSVTLSLREAIVESMLEEAEATFNDTMLSVTKIQTFWKSVVARRKLRRDLSVEKMGAHEREFHIRKQKSATTLQTLLRGITKRRKYARLRKGFIKLQALYRMRVVRKVFCHVIRSTTKLQASFRMKVCYRDMERNVSSTISTLRKVIYQLWALTNKPLDYRSRFWSYVGQHSFFYLLFHIEEVKNLWKELSFDSAMLQYLTYPLLFNSDNKIETYVSSKYVSATAENKALLTERKKLYALMKSGIKGAEDQKVYFELFGIGNKKKRKQDLAHLLLWKNIESASESSTVVLSLLDIDDKDEWIKKQYAVRPGAFSMVGIVKALMAMR